MQGAVSDSLLYSQFWHLVKAINIILEEMRASQNRDTQFEKDMNTKEGE